MSTPLSPDYWNARYSEQGFAYGDQPNGFLVAAHHHLPPRSRILVPGDGEGRNGVWLAEQGHHVTTIDMSEAGCSKARQLAAARGVNIDVMCADLSTWDWPVKHFNAVVSIFLHLPSALRPTIHARMSEALVEGGMLLIEAYTPANLAHRAKNPNIGGPGDVSMLYSLNLLARDFAPLAMITGEERETDLDEGRYHVGRGAVVRAVFKATGAVR
jgi:protein-L-isoaspartate O-methyltransferase